MPIITGGNVIEGAYNRPILNAGVPTDGTSGTGAGAANKGDLAIDTTNGKIYINGGTKASPTWKLVTSAA